VRCQEKHRLLTVYKAKVLIHAALLNDLTLMPLRFPKQEYERLWALAEKARTDSEAASLELFKHAHEHGC
jgi:hypothetical protein